MRREQKRSLFLIVAAVLLLVAVYILLGVYGEKYEGGERKLILWNIDEGKIERIAFNGAEGNVTLVRKGDTWVYEQDEEFPLNLRFVESMLEKTAVLKAEQYVCSGREWFAEYGLAVPSNEIIIETGEETKKIWLGDTNSTTGDCYMRVDGEEAVYIVDSTFSNLFSNSINQMAARETLPGILPDNMTAFSVKQKLGETVFFKGEEKQTNQGINSWQVGKSLGQYQTADDERVKALLAQLLKLRYEKMVVYRPDSEAFEAYGFAEPLAVLSMEYELKDSGEKRQFVLRVGNETDSEFYVYPEEGLGIYTVDKERMAVFLQLTIEEFLPLDVAAINAEGLKGLSITSNSRVLRLDIEHSREKGEDTYYLNGREITQTKFNTFYYPLYVLEADKRVQGLTEQLEHDPVLTLIYEQKKEVGEDLIVEFVPYDQNYYGVRVDGEAFLLINRQKVNYLLTEMERLEKDF